MNSSRRVALVAVAVFLAACGSSQKQLTEPQQAAAKAQKQAEEAQEDAQNAHNETVKTQRDLYNAEKENEDARRAEAAADQKANMTADQARRATQAANMAAPQPQRRQVGVTEAQGPSKPAPKPPPAKVVVMTTGLLFASGSSDLSPETRSSLDELVAALKSNPESHDLVLSGHTDDTGGAAENTHLSEERAQAVADYLESQGIPRDRIQTRGFGQAQPSATEKTPVGRALNRRVDIVVTPAVPGQSESTPSQGQPQPSQGHQLSQGHQPSQGQPQPNP